MLVSNYAYPLGQNKNELFPFFNWGLFTNDTKSETVRVEVVIEQIGQSRLGTPKFAQQLRKIFPGVGDGTALRKLAFSLILAHKTNDDEQAARFLNILENKFLRGQKDVTYKVVYTKYNPLKRIRTGDYEIIETVLSRRKGESY